jgi:hypothetical protein
VDIWGILTWGAVLIGVLLLAAGVLTWARRKLTAKAPPAGVGEGTAWTLDGLRDLQGAGLINDEEYQRLRKKLIASMKETLAAAGSQAAPGEKEIPASPPDKDESAPSAPGEGPADKPGPQGSEPAGSNEGQAG